MAVEQTNDRDVFVKYLDEHYPQGLNGHTLEEALAEFREYQRQLADLRAKIERAKQASERGESGPLMDEDRAKTHERLNAILASEGITD